MAKLFKRYDLQDTTDVSIETMGQMKDWLIDFWNFNPDEDMSDEEHEEFIKRIINSDEDELLDIMSGIDYTFEEE